MRLNKTQKKLNFIIGLIDIRCKSIQDEFNRALAKKEWSKLAGFDGIDIGLLMARRIIEEEIKYGK